MKELENLKELYIDEIKKINKKGELTPADSEAAKKALEAIEKINEICCDEEELEGGYSERGSSYAYPGMRRMPRYSRNMMPEVYNPMNPMSYTDDYHRTSYARNRDSMGRYSSRGMDYSRHSAVDHMIEKLEGMLETAPDERKRMAIERCISELESY